MPRHRVLVAYPISDEARARLQTFFDVECRIKERPADRNEQIAWLQDKAGVIGDGSLVFDAPTIEQLPTLKAVCTMAASHEHLDLPALTRAGIRATQAPHTRLSQQDAMHLLDPAWERILASARAALERSEASGRYIGQWSRQLTLGLPRGEVKLTLADKGPLAEALAVRAQLAGMIVHRTPQFQAVQPGQDDVPPAWRLTDLLVLTPTQDSAQVQLTPQMLHTLKPRARVLNLAGLSALAPDLQQDSLGFERVDSSLCATDLRHVPTPESAGLDRSRVAADELIASLGFGRNSWHPHYLLNTDIACESCC